MTETEQDLRVLIHSLQTAIITLSREIRDLRARIDKLDREQAIIRGDL